jgi:hypothetical protein
MVCRLTTCCGVFSESPGAEGTPLVKSPRLRHIPTVDVQPSLVWYVYMTMILRPAKRPHGRPPALDRVRVVLKLRRDTDKALYRGAAQENITKSEFVERAIAERLERLA